MTSEPKHDPLLDPASSGEVLSLLHRQVDLYRRFESLADRQRNLIAEEDSQPLLRLLADRRKLIDELTVMSDQLEPYRANWSTMRESLTPDQQGTAEQLLREAGKCLERIIDGDNADVKLLTARKTRTATAVSEVQAGQRMLAAYGDSSHSSGARLDRTDEV